MFFRDEYRFLSNFYPVTIGVNGLWFPSVEHAFQAMKCQSQEEMLAFCSGDPVEARRRERLVCRRPGFEEGKEQLMMQLLRMKFAYPQLRDKLIATGDIAIVEENTWGDTYWGVCKGTGLNRLGVLLMQVREEVSRASQ